MTLNRAEALSLGGGTYKRDSGTVDEAELVTVCEGTRRDDSQGFWLGDYADDGDSSQARGHGRETHLMEEN